MAEFCCVAVPLNRATGCGLSRQDSWKTVKPPPRAAIRETMEEANANIAIGELYSMYNLPHINQVHLLFRAKLLDLNFFPGAESLEVALFPGTRYSMGYTGFPPGALHPATLFH